MSSRDTRFLMQMLVHSCMGSHLEISDKNEFNGQDKRKLEVYLEGQLRHIRFGSFLTAILFAELRDHTTA
ncbi:hypothetical protein GJ744_008786 [Endocarpon pusillum]|uniref:Uncharacterized protein n=1 Tax=Endocarpon pusillum TaxID=364733 RepID=A0A8H7E8S8_9EURO|nr:hypothetical protein GJ744_008786 [Endocarpon pusillum]